MASLVFSYAHADEALRNELEKHLSPLKRMGRITTWHDRRIVPGQVFAEQIDQQFAEADVILLLVSSDFINLDYCYEVEMGTALQRHERGEAIVIPVILRPCAWKQLPFGKLLAATVDGKPVVQFPSFDEGFVQVVDAVSRALDKLSAQNSVQSLNHSKPIPVRSVDVIPDAGIGYAPRSSNLAIPNGLQTLIGIAPVGKGLIIL
ncbi:MAG: toll/interleukin-1 receptor domain-containing protein, partial [Pseudohongiella sp.]|nr:toll/interleukin-1 receptor domain-containing protein [Pseudohongiella sp.]